jgi:hypothetical protein
MKIANFGIVKAIISGTFSEVLLEGTNNVFGKKKIKEFVEVLKGSDLLRTEYMIFSNLEGKHIDNDTLITKYIDENISLLKKYTKQDLISEHKKLDQFIDESVILLDENQVKLYENIHSLIYESLDGHNVMTDVDKLYDSFTHVFEHVKKPKVAIVESESNIKLDSSLNTDLVIERALSKFNERFTSLSEEEKKILNTIAFAEEKDKKALFEALKSEGLVKLSELKNKGIHEDKVNESIEKVKGMQYNKQTLTEDVIHLNLLKSL